MKTYTSTEIRKKFSDAYNTVRHAGDVVAISHHGDESVIMIRKADVYPEPAPTDLFQAASHSGAFVDDSNINYE